MGKGPLYHFSINTYQNGMSSPQGHNTCITDVLNVLLSFNVLELQVYMFIYNFNFMSIFIICLKPKPIKTFCKDETWKKHTIKMLMWYTHLFCFVSAAVARRHCSPLGGGAAVAGLSSAWLDSTQRSKTGNGKPNERGLVWLSAAKGASGKTALVTNSNVEIVSVNSAGTF